MGQHNVIKGTKGNDNLAGTDGKDKIISGKGDDTIDAGAGNDIVKSGKGNDIVDGGSGNDYIKAGKGDDIVTGGAGDDCVHLGKGNDTAVYVLADNVDSEDFYNGGKGHDTLRLEFTSEEWQRADIQADIAAYLAFLNGDEVPDEYWHNRSTFEFNAFNLTAKKFENLELVVDGQVINPGNGLVDAVDDSFTVSEDGIVSGNVLDNDDVPDLVASITVEDDVTKGILTLNPDGSFSFDTNGEFDDLDAGDTETQTFTYKVIDTNGDEDIATVTFTITGTDDASVVAGSFTGMVTEGDVGDPAETAMGTLSISDVDGDDTPSFADQGSTVGDNGYGSFVLAAGVWTYTLDQSTVQDLDAGDSVNDSITYTATDGTTQQIVVTIEGTDDASVVAGSFTGMVTEGDVGDPAETAMGTLSISDVDGDDTPSFADQGSTVGDNGYGSFVLAAGVWTYTLDQSTVQDLDAGDSVNDSITYTATDGTTQQIVVTIEGTDDASVVAGSFTGMVTEGDVGDPAETAMGTLSISDVDGDDTPSFADQGSTVGDNGYGSFVLAAGVWTYTLDQSAVQDLDAGDSVNDSITYTATDGTTQQIVVTIEGTDDASVVAGMFTGMVTEGDIGDPAETAMGTLSISDVDGDDTPSFADQGSTVGDNGYGSFVLAAGVWTYTLDQSTVQDLDAGDSVNDSITYTATDGTTQQIVVTIEGTDDASVVAGSFTGMVTEGDIGDPAETAMGTLSISDVDGDDNPSFVDQGSTVGDNGYGSFVLAAGTWTYTLDQSAVQDLDAGDSVNDSITYTATDGTTQQIAVMIEGTDDASVVAGMFTGMVTEGDVGDPAETAMGTLSISDVDGDDTPSFADQGSTVGDNGYGSFVLAAGVWTYTLDQSTVQDLDAGDSVNDSITYTATDGTSQQIVVSIEGTDDASVVAGSFTGMVTEGDVGDPAETAMGTLSISDVDGDDTPSFADQGSTVGDNSYGSFVLAAGVWTYALDQSTVQDLDAGDSVNDSITYTATDGTTQQIAVMIEGTDDASVVAGSFTGMVTEGDVGDPAETAMGTLSISDVDGDDNPSFADQGSTVGDNGYGSFVLAAGVWTYTLDQSTVQDLDAGESVNDSITYTATDGTTQQIVVMILGTNEDPIAMADVATVVEDGSVLIDVLDNDSDPDGGMLTISNINDPAHGTAVLQAGQILYTPDADFSGNDSFTYTIDDGAGGTDTQTVTVTVNVDADTPIVTASLGSTPLQLGTPVALNITGMPADMDGSEQITQYRIDGLPEGATLNAGVVQTDGSVILTPAELAGLELMVSGVPAFDASFDLSSLNGSNGFVLNGIDGDDSSGTSVSSVGDINGDGIDDLIIGARGADPNGVIFAGETYVVFGSTSSFSASFDLSSLNGSNGFVLNGIDTSDSSGVSVSRAGDINGDGIDDLIIGALGADPNGALSAGESYLVFGSTNGFSASFDLGSLNGSNGFVLNGTAGDQSGISVSGAGDINGDSIDDVIIGARRADPNGDTNAGESYVVFGSNTGFSASLELSSLNGSNGFVLNGIDSVDESGFSVSGAGDINGDGIDDLIIGALGADPNGLDRAGESYVVFGQDTVNGTGFSASFDLSTLNGSNGFVLNGIDSSDLSGFSVSGAGDINGDGIDDLIIGARGADPNGDTNAGESYVVFGSINSFSASFDLSSLNGSNGFVLNGIDAGDLSGYSVSSAGDINGDGIDDLIIGAVFADPNGDSAAGESYVVFGQDTVNGTGFSASFDLSTLNGSNGFVLNGIDSSDLSGFSVSGAGDINGDGIDDLIIGARGADPNGVGTAGESYVVFGREGLAPEDFQLTVEATVVDTNPDNAGDTDTAVGSTTLDVDVNQNPTVEAASFTVDENVQQVGTISFSDPDGDDVTIALTSNAATDNALFAIDPQTGLLTFIDSNGADFENPLDIGMDNIYDIEVEVTDGNGASTLEQFQVAVDDVGQAVLEISDSDPFNFGVTVVNTSAAKVFVITNTGGEDATDVIGGFSSIDHFNFVGGSYPGQGIGSTCGTEIAAGESCNLVVEFLPQQAGAHVSNLNIGYEDGEGAMGMVSTELLGTAI